MREAPSFMGAALPRPRLPLDTPSMLTCWACCAGRRGPPLVVALALGAAAAGEVEEDWFNARADVVGAGAAMAAHGSSSSPHPSELLVGLGSTFGLSMPASNGRG